MKAFYTQLILLIPFVGFGQYWQKTNGPYGGEGYAFLKIDNEIFSGSINGIFHSNDNGEIWHHILETDTIFDLYYHNNLLLAGSEENIYISSDNGLSWNMSSNGLSNIAVYCIKSYNNDILIGTSNGVYKSSDNGVSWNFSSIGMPSTKVYDLEIIGSKIFCVTNLGLFNSDNGGLSWSAINSFEESFPPTPNNFYSFCDLSSSNNNIYVTNKAYGLFMSSDLGISWNNITPTSIPNVLGGSIGDPGPVVNVHNNMIYYSSNGILCRSTNNGISWTYESIGYYAHSINFEGNNIYLSGSYGILKSYNSQSSNNCWENIGMGAANQVNSLLSTNGILFAGTDAGVYYSNDEGLNWRRAKYDFCFSNSTNGITGGACEQSAYYMVSNGAYFLTSGGKSGHGVCRSNDGINFSRANTNLNNIGSAYGFAVSSIMYYDNDFYLYKYGEGLYKSPIANYWQLINNNPSLSTNPQYTNFASMKSSYPVIYSQFTIGGGVGVAGGDLYLSTDGGSNFILTETNTGAVLFASGSEVATHNKYSNDFGSSWTSFPELGGWNSGGYNAVTKYNNKYYLSNNYGVYQATDLSLNNSLDVSSGLICESKIKNFVEHNTKLFAAINCNSSNIPLTGNSNSPNGVYLWVNDSTNNPQISFDCINDACVDPLDGSGEFSTLNDCEQVCQNISSISENLIDINIFPNPSSNIFNLEFKSDSETEILVTNILGKQVYFESTKSIGEFNTQIDLSDYSKGIYNLTIKNTNGISNHKLILQ